MKLMGNEMENVNDASKQASKHMTDDRFGSYFLILPTRWVFLSLSLSLWPCPPAPLPPSLPSLSLSLPLLSEFLHAPPTDRTEYPKYDDRQTARQRPAQFHQNSLM